jgi:hypothetical protein
MDNDSIAFQQSLFLSPNLLRDVQTSSLTRKLGGKFRRPKKAAILNGVEGTGGQEIKSACLSEVDMIVCESFMLEITGIDSNRTRSQLNQNSAKPRFEQGCVTLS